MQALNIIDPTISNLISNSYHQYNEQAYQNQVEHLPIALMSRLQTTLNITNLLNIFLETVASNTPVTGIYFVNQEVNESSLLTNNSEFSTSFKLQLNENLLGVLTYLSNKPLTNKHSQWLQNMHEYFLNPLNNALQYYQAMQLAMKDGLTSLGNRRNFDEQLIKTMSHAKRRTSDVGLILCDLNKFKAINDNYGHALGDNILVHFAKALTKCIRECDSAFRFGGDEFALIIEDANEQALAIIKQRLTDAMANDPLLVQYQVTTSIGATLMSDNENVEDFFKRTDDALYRDKHRYTIAN